MKVRQCPLKLKEWFFVKNFFFSINEMWYEKTNISQIRSISQKCSKFQLKNLIKTLKQSLLKIRKKKFSIFSRINFFSEEFEEIKEMLHKSFRNCYIELIKICLNETIIDILEGLVFKIDKSNQTASLFKVNWQC